MVKYNLEHLIQGDDQHVVGPIQDDEALFLYSIIRGCRLKRILEIGGLGGYSAKNFLQAISYSEDGIVYTCDINNVPTLCDNHKVIIKNALHITQEDLDSQPLDLIFFDCHDTVQMDVYYRLSNLDIINDKTIIALHDTNLHYAPYLVEGEGVYYDYVEEEGGYIHQRVEREMVNTFKSLGYDIFSISTDASKHSTEFPFRHGVTICKKFKNLII